MDIKKQTASLSALATYKYFKHNDDDELYPFGFDNVGANCWLNTMLQCLISCTSFNQYMQDNVDAFVLNPAGREYIKILEENEPNGSIAFLHALVKSVKKPNSLKLSGQQCCHEGMTKFTECLMQPRIERMFEWIYRVEIECPSCKEKSITRDTSNFVQHSVTYDLPVEKFVDALRNREVVIVDYVCGKCKTKSHTTRRECLVRAGEIVCVTLGKYQTTKQFPTTFQIVSKKGTLNYKLVAIADHWGDHSGGHYAARVLRQGHWYTCNDTSVSTASPTPTGSESMLMYEMY